MPTGLEVKGGYKTLVDDADADFGLFTWFVNSQGYVVRTQPTMVRLHRAIMERMKGRWLKDDEEVDHINGNKLDNTRDNLRLATRSQNQQNRGPNGSRPYKGVYRSQAEADRWVAKITFEGEQEYLGTFRSPKRAALEYDKYARALHGEMDEAGAI
jgi:hypothetical protein